MTVAAWTPGTGTTLYVHVPFCVVKCGYCDFNSYADHSRDSHAAFLRGLDRELALVAPAQPPTVFFGGGTPTFLAADQFAELFAIVARHVDLSACHEVTVEANPESLTLEKAHIARTAGVNRFSVGAQSFDPDRLRFLDRAHDAAAVGAAVGAVRAAGFDNVSLDLMFSLPGQTPEQWNRDLDAALALGPDHMSCYNLAFEPGTRLTHDLNQGRVTANDPEVDLELFELTRDRLRGRGFEPYEISNFAGRGGPCRHNDHYWLQGNYVGVGPGASSHLDGYRTTNLKVVSSWAGRIERGELAIGDSERLDPATRAGEAVWLGLRRAEGVDLAMIEERTQWPATTAFDPIIERYGALGYLRRAGHQLGIVASAERFADALATAFLHADASR